MACRQVIGLQPHRWKNFIAGQTFQRDDTFTIGTDRAEGALRDWNREKLVQDHEMINRIRRGERALFGQLADKYYNEVFRYCYYQTGEEQAAYDCTQETFYRLLRFLDSYTEHGRFKAYLLRVALNVCRDYFRKNGRQNFSLEELAEQTGAPPVGGRRQEEGGSASIPSPERQVETRLLVQEALGQLTDIQREVIVLFYYHGYKQREIARITGVPLSTVKTRLRAGTAKLQMLFGQMGLWTPGE